MYKKEIFRDLDKKYNSHLYSGLLGVLMNYCHRTLENFKGKKNSYDKILEIGAGSAPHYKYINHSYNEYHVAETSNYAKDFHKENSKVKFVKYDGKKLPYNNETFDRIIISHCLEHILSPEEFIEEMMSKLNKGGVLSFTIEGVHPHDIATILDEDGVAIRAGHHCCQILHDKLEIPASARASVGVYNTKEDFDQLNESINKCKKIFDLK